MTRRKKKERRGGKRAGAGRKAGPGGPGEMVPWRVAPSLIDAVRTHAEASGKTPGEVHSSALARGLGIAEAPNIADQRRSPE